MVITRLELNRKNITGVEGVFPFPKIHDLGILIFMNSLIQMYMRLKCKNGLIFGDSKNLLFSKGRLVPIQMTFSNGTAGTQPNTVHLISRRLTVLYSCERIGPFQNSFQ